MDNSGDDTEETTQTQQLEVPNELSLPLQNSSQPVENSLLTNDTADELKIVSETSDSINQTSTETVDASSQNEKVASESNPGVSTENSMPSLPPLPMDDKGPQPSVPYSADYNMQNYANYNYMYNYNNYYGYPYPQYQWDYNSQQYYQPYQNYYNYNYNANQVQTSSKPPPPPPDAVQLPVEEKPAGKSNASAVDDSNRYSPTAETDDDDTMKGVSENKSDTLTEQLTISSVNSINLKTLPSEQIEIQQNESESLDNAIHQPLIPSVTTPVQKPVPVIAQIAPYNIAVQKTGYLVNPQIQMQSKKAAETTNQQQNSPAVLNGKDDSVEKVSKGSTVLGKTQAKKRLMAFSMMKQKLQEQSNSNNDNQSSDIGEGNDVEFVPELNVFQTVPKKKVVTNKKVVKIIKAQQTIEQIEEMKKDELLQGNNAALYQHLLRSGGNEAPILQKLGIESLAEKYSAKIREQDKRLKRHHHRRRDDNRRSHKYRHHRSHSKSRSRSRSAEKPKMRALEVKSWKDFTDGGFHFDKFRRFKMDETEEIKEKERKSRIKKRHGESRSDGKNQNIESTLSVEAEKGEVGDQKLRYNLLDRKKEILKGFEVAQEGDYTKVFPSYTIRCTKSKPVVKFSTNPLYAKYHFQNRQKMFATLLPEIEAIVLKFLSNIKPKKLRDNPVEDYYIQLDDKLIAMMKDINIYPFKGWWPKKYFIVTQVKEDPNVEIDKDALTNEFTTSKRTKKSRFNDDTSLVDIRPTVPSKWDSDYDGSPAAADKVMDVEVSQNLEMATDDTCIINRQEKNTLDIEHRNVETMDTTSDTGKNEPKIDVKVCPISPNLSQEPQVHAKLDTEYEEFLKIVSAEKTEEKIDNNESITTINKDVENNLSMKSSTPLIDESVQDESEEDSSTKSSDEFASLYSTGEKSIDRSFVKRTSVDKKFKKKKKASNKKSKKLKKKENKKKKHKSSSSESSQDSESDSESSSEDSVSETTDSTSTVEKKKNKCKDKKKKKSKINFKKKHKSDKNKTKTSVDEKDNKSSILNLLEKAFNVEIKKRILDEENLKQKKKKKKYHKNEDKSNEEDEDKFEKVKECLKETFTKLVKTDKITKNSSLSSDDNTVTEVLKYFKMDDDKEKKNKKLKKSSKRKHDSEISDEERTPKKLRLDIDSKIKDGEKKKKSKKKKSSEKKSNDSVEHTPKKRSKKKSKNTDTSGTDDSERLTHKKMKKSSEPFFGLRPNEWNVNINSSMRGVVHHSDVKNTNYSSSTNDTSRLDDKVNIRSKSPKSSDENSCPSDSENNQNETLRSNISKTNIEQKEKAKKHLEISEENINNCESNISKNIVEENIRIISNNSVSESGKEKASEIENDEISNKYNICDNNVSNHKNDVSQTILLAKSNNNEPQDSIKDFVEKLPQNKSLNHNYKPPISSTIIKPIGETISYRDKVKMNLKKLSTCQHIPFVFGLSSPLRLIKSNNLNIEKIKSNFEINKEEIKPKVDESKLLKFDRPKVLICPQTQRKKSNVTNIIPPKIDMEANTKVIDSTYNQVDSEESDSKESDSEESDSEESSSENSSSEESITSNTNTSENICAKGQSEIIKSGLFKSGSYKYKENDTSGNDIVGKERKYRYDTSDSSSSSDSEDQSQNISLELRNTVIKNELITLSNSSDYVGNFEQLSESNLIVSQNNADMISTIKDSDAICSQNSSYNFETSKIDSELINQWTSDWNKLNQSVFEVHSSSAYQTDDSSEVQSKKKSRWDAQPKYHEMGEFKGLTNEQKDFEDEMNNFTTEKNECPKDDILEEQVCEINCVVNDTRYHSESWVDEYDNDCSQSNEQYSFVPQYSAMKTIKNNTLVPVDYSIYENYNPNYAYHNEDHDTWTSVDTSDQLTNFSTANETLVSSIQVGNVLEILPSDNLSNEEDKVSNENIQDNIIKDEKSAKDHNDKEFFKLYQQYFRHYNQNPIKYSMSEPILDDIKEVNLNLFEKSLPQEKLDTDQKDDKTIPIPLKNRGYTCIIEDENTNIYLTSDNYIAYCAIEDQCMVHIAVDSSSRDSIGDEVRHCFNVNQNGTTGEYWLHADLIPFHISSDAESGVFSDDEEDSCESDSGQEDDVVDNDDDDDDDDENNDDDNIIEGEWEIIDSDCDENSDNWLNDPRIINKYGGNNIDDVEQTITDINQDEYLSNSSEYDSDGSDFSDSHVETGLNEKQNIAQVFQNSSDNKNECQNVVDKIMSVNVAEQPNDSVENSDLLVETANTTTALPHKLVSNIKVVNKEDTEEVTDLVIECNDNILIKSEEKENCYEKKSAVSLKGEIPIDDVSMMNTIINQQILIQKLKLRTKQKVQEKLPDTVMVHYSDNMETIKHPFLGLFQPPTISILSTLRSSKKDTSNLSKRVTFADGIHPGENLAESPTHDDVGRPLSPPPLKALLRETLKFKRNMYPLKRSKVRTKLVMMNKKVATVTPSIKTTSSSVIEYYISRQRLEDLPVVETSSNSVPRSDNSSSSDDHNSAEKMTTPPRPTREVTPIPSDSECWNDDDNIKDLN